MITVICTFCGLEFAKGTGLLYAKKDGSLFYFCSSKCRKNNLGLKREGRRQQWTHAYRVFKGKEKEDVKMAEAEAPKPEKKAK